MKTKCLLLLSVVLFVLAGCSDPEAKLTVKSLNEDPRLTNRNVHVKKVAFTEQRKEAVRAFEADILNEKGDIVGKASGRRVEGFGTARPRVEWYDKALADKSLDPPSRVNQKMYDQLLPADTDGDGRVSYEEAVAAKPHLMRAAFDGLDRNGDGVISKEDTAFKGRRKQGGGPFGRLRNMQSQPPPDMPNPDRP